MLISNKKGQSLVEFALILPVLLLLLLGIVEFGLAFNAHVTLVHAAREGARYGAVRYKNESAEGKAEIENIVRGAAANLDKLDQEDQPMLVLNPEPEWENGNLKVNVKYTFELFDPVISAIVGDSFVMRASAVMAVE